MNRPDRERHMIAQLQQAAASYEPAADRIRALMEARAEAEARGTRWSRSAESGPGRGTPTLRPLAGFAAAAAVIAVVFAAIDPLGPSRGAQPAGGGPSIQVLGPSSVTPSRSAPPSPASTSPAADPAVTTTRLGDREVTITVRVVPVGTPVVPAASGSDWVITPGPSDADHLTSARSPRRVGPVQVMGSGAATGPSGFSVGETPAATREITQWLTVPGATRGATAGVRVPIRFRAEPVAVTVFAGTLSGAGTLTVSLAASGGTGQATAALPKCVDDRCPMVVTVAVGRADGRATAQSGDLLLDLAAVAPDDRIAVAAVALTS